MKCPYCGQEHPDNFQFCPVTGKKIEIIKESTSELIACTNPSCDDYGKHILPADSRFCPSCGEKIKDKEEYIALEVNGVKFRMIKVGAGSFESDLTKIRAIDRFDVELWDTESVIYAPFTGLADLTPAAKPSGLGK